MVATSTSQNSHACSLGGLVFASRRRGTSTAGYHCAAARRSPRRGLRVARSARRARASARSFSRMPRCRLEARPSRDHRPTPSRRSSSLMRNAGGPAPPKRSRSFASFREADETVRCESVAPDQREMRSLGRQQTADEHDVIPRRGARVVGHRYPTISGIETRCLNQLSHSRPWLRSSLAPRASTRSRRKGPRWWLRTLTLRRKTVETWARWLAMLVA